MRSYIIEILNVNSSQFKKFKIQKEDCESISDGRGSELTRIFWRADKEGLAPGLIRNRFFHRIRNAVMGALSSIVLEKDVRATYQPKIDHPEGHFNHLVG